MINNISSPEPDRFISNFYDYPPPYSDGEKMSSNPELSSEDYQTNSIIKNSSPKITRQSSFTNQMAHELALAREENKMAALHALDILDHNKYLTNKNSLLQNQIKCLHEKVNKIGEDKKLIEMQLEFARKDRNTVAEIGHNRETQLQCKIESLESSKNLFETGKSHFSMIVKENDLLTKQLQTEKQNSEKISSYNKIKINEITQLRQRESKYLKEITKLEGENVNCHKEICDIKYKLGHFEGLENEKYDLQVKNEECNRIVEDLKHQLLLTSDENTNLKSQLDSQLHHIAKLEKAYTILKQKHPEPYIFKNSKNQKSNRIKSKSLISSSSTSEESEKFNPYNIIPNNQNKLVSNSKTDIPVLIFKSMKQSSNEEDSDDFNVSLDSIDFDASFDANSMKLLNFSIPGRINREKGIVCSRNMTNLNTEIQLEKLKSKIDNLTLQNETLTRDYKQKEATLISQIESLHTNIKQYQEQSTKYKSVYNDFIKVCQILNFYELSPDLLECQLEEKLCRIDIQSPINTKTIPELLNIKTQIINKLKVILETKDENTKKLVDLERINGEKLVNDKNEIIQQLVDEIVTRKNKEIEFSHIKEEVLAITKKWQSILNKMVNEIKVKDKTIKELKTSLRTQDEEITKYKYKLNV